MKREHRRSTTQPPHWHPKTSPVLKRRRTTFISFPRLTTVTRSRREHFHGAPSSHRSYILKTQHQQPTPLNVQLEMDAFKGRSQTTKGIWIAKAVGVEPCTIVMDLEGTDGRERGEDDTTFEKQSALFALAVSDIVLINMVVHWCQSMMTSDSSE
ncbi:hypothetical protein TEA_022346 [Camellia sinensis var. sinensis]|uniref:GB1/RHD3-type G domain-containing protein n=1 Tax=Camellia sinensis var. sinensis TaxID=542762 RepID=A0A4S4D3I0_CAMSN|nr:hypothetical protein TEA_022346 [Camellia sinensis var. sinensis]